MSTNVLTRFYGSQCRIMYRVSREITSSSFYYGTNKLLTYLYVDQFLQYLALVVNFPKVV